MRKKNERVWMNGNETRRKERKKVGKFEDEEEEDVCIETRDIKKRTK